MNKVHSRIGYHSSLSSISEEIARGVTNTFQVFVGNPKFMQVASQKSLENLAKYDCDFIMHSPYTVNLVRKENLKTLEYTARYIADLYRRLPRFTTKLIPFVCHTGYSTENYTEDIKTMIETVNAIDAMLDNVDYKLWIETDSGHKKGSGSTSLLGLNEVLDNVNSDRLAICLDTEHTYADGVDIQNLSEDMLRYVECIHLNSIPSYVEFGGHLDRHSTTYLSESKIGTGFVKPLMELAIKKNLPVILERDGMNFIMDDINTINQLMEN